MQRQIFDGPANFVGSQTENGFYKYVRLNKFLQKQERHFSPVTGHNVRYLKN